jgi:hypothetical protein
MSEETTFSVEITFRKSRMYDRLNIDPEKVAEIAFVEFDDWINGRKRPRTISELVIDRLYKVFTEASVPRELTEEALVRDFRFSLAQARHYLSAVSKRYPDIISSVIEDLIRIVQEGTEDDGKIRFKIVEEQSFVFRQIAKKRGWVNEQVRFKVVGPGQRQVEIDSELKAQLVEDLKDFI